MEWKETDANKDAIIVRYYYDGDDNLVGLARLSGHEEIQRGDPTFFWRIWVPKRYSGSGGRDNVLDGYADSLLDAMTIIETIAKTFRVKEKKMQELPLEDQWYIFIAGYCSNSPDGMSWAKHQLLDNLDVGSIETELERKRCRHANAAIDQLIRNDYLVPDQTQFGHWKWNHEKKFEVPKG